MLRRFPRKTRQRRQLRLVLGSKHAASTAASLARSSSAKTPSDYGINAIWVGSGRLDAAEIDRYHRLGVKVFAEFNSMHSASNLKEHPDAAPIGPDGKPSPPPHKWPNRDGAVQ